MTEAPRDEHRGTLRTATARVVDHPRFVPACIMLGFAARVVWVIVAMAQGTVPVTDAAWYYARAASIAAGEGYVIEGVVTAYWPVGYPAFLGGVFTVAGVSVTAGAVANLLLWLATALAAYRVARGVLGSERAARLTVALMAVHPNNIAYTSLLMSEPLALCLLMAGALLVIAPKRDGGGWALRDLCAGLVFGAAVLVKPQLALLPALLYLLVSRGARREGRNGPRIWKRISIAYAAMALAVLPWTLRNHAAFGEHGIIANNGGVNLYIGNNPDATGTYLLDEEIEARYRNDASEVVADANARRLALEYVAAHPGEALARVPRKLWYFLRSDIEGFRMNTMGRAGYSNEGTRRLYVKEFIAQAYWVLLLAFTLAALPLVVRLRRDVTRPALFVGAGVILYISAIPIIVFGDPRFHFPMVPWMMMYTALFLEQAIRGRTGQAGA